MNLEHINNSIANINIKYNKIKKNYEKLYSEIPNLNNNNIILPYENLILLEISLDDFANQLESIFLFIKFEKNDLENKKLLEQQSNVSNVNNINNINNINDVNDMNDMNDVNDINNINDVNYVNDVNNINNTNKLVDKTLKNMLPLFFFYLMAIDNNSILNSKTFGNLNINNNLNGEPKINISSEIEIEIKNYNYLNIELD